jgi:acyl-CoA thioesterase
MHRDRRIHELFAAEGYSARLGIGLIATDPVTVAMPITADHLNFYGNTHGGAVFSLADCALALAANADGVPAVVIDTHLALTATTSAADTLTATVEAVTSGRTLATYRAKITRGDGRVAALLTGTVRLSPPGQVESSSPR